MEKYKNIINLPHKQSTRRPQMSRIDCADQFASYAALTGCDDAIKETKRLTDAEIDLSVEMLNVLNMKYQILVDWFNEEHEVSFTYFVPDGEKSGGAYVTKQGMLQMCETYKKPERRLYCYQRKEPFTLCIGNGLKYIHIGGE